MHSRILLFSHWRHYKSLGGTDDTYEVIGIVKHSETQEDMVLYRPLFALTAENWAYGYNSIVRPLSIWYDVIDWNGERFQRFTQI